MSIFLLPELRANMHINCWVSVDAKASQPDENGRRNGVFSLGLWLDGMHEKPNFIGGFEIC